MVSGEASTIRSVQTSKELNGVRRAVPSGLEGCYSV